VLAEPASDDLRMVYADYLLERGDPRSGRDRGVRIGAGALEILGQPLKRSA
jgi:uncharacterized protein (TIGR02996 family)